MVKGLTLGLMVTNMLVDSRTINETDTAPIPMVPKVNGQGTNTLVNGRMTNTTDSVFITPTVAKRSNYCGIFFTNKNCRSK